MMSSTQEKKSVVALDSGDEFEDFPVENWDTQLSRRPANLWEESWEDDDHLDDDFASTLKAEAAKKAYITMSFDFRKPTEIFVAEMLRSASAVRSSAVELAAGVARAAEHEKLLLEVDAFVQALASIECDAPKS